MSQVGQSPRWHWSDETRRVFWTAAAVLAFPAVYNGYPMFNYDTGRYLEMAVHQWPSPHTTNVLPYLLRPALVVSPWPWVLLQVFFGAYCFARLSEHFPSVRRKPLLVVLCVALSGAGLHTGILLMDAFTVTGFLALFLVLEGGRFPLLLLVLAISTVAHFGNVPSIFVAGALYAVVARRTSWKVALAAWCCGLLILGSCTYLLEGEFRLSGRSGGCFISSRMMADLPEAVMGYMREHPASLTARNGDLFARAVEERYDQTGFLWTKQDEKGPMYVIGHDIYEPEGWRFIEYAVWRHPLEQAWALVANTAANVFSGRFPFPHFNCGARVKPWAVRYYPGDETTIEHTLQYQGRIGVLCWRRLYRYAYWASLLVVAGLVCGPLLGKGGTAYRGKMGRRCATFVVLALVSNAFVMGAVAGTHSRYSARMFVLAVTAAVFGLSELWEVRRGTEN